MFFWKNKSIADVAPKLPLSELRKRARILVVDDDEKAFPYKLLQKEGYNVTYWRHVDNLRELETGEYDIIVLDILGIAGPRLSEDDGLGILTHIKRYNPSQIIVAYSGQKFDLSHSEFWKLADDYLGKPSSLLDCKQKIDVLLEQRFTAHYYVNVLRKLLLDQGVSQKKITKLELLLVGQKDKELQVSAETIAKYTGIARDVATVASVVCAAVLKLIANPT